MGYMWWDKATKDIPSAHFRVWDAVYQGNGLGQKRNYLKNIVLTLERKDFNLLRRNKGNMADSAIGIVRRNMQCLQENSKTSNHLLGKLDVPPGLFLELEGAPAETPIVCGRGDKAKGNPFNAAFRKRYPKSLRSLKMHCPLEKGNYPAIG
jgi:hypothetical protein